MIRWSALCFIALLFLSGCESTPSFNNLSNVGLSNNTPAPYQAFKLLRNSSSCCQSFADFSYTPLNLEATMAKEMTSSSPTFQFSQGLSFFQAYKLPETKRPFDIEVYSIAAQDKVFAPTAIILDSQYNPVTTFGNEHFIYKTAGMFKPERLEANLEKIGGFSDHAYLVIYSTAEQQKGQTQLIHPAKQFARSQNKAEPDIPDPIAKHSPLGVISLYAQHSDGSNPVKTKTASVPKAKEIAPEVYVHEEIKKAVAEGRIEDAMTLVEDAEANGIGSARKTFIEAVKNTQSE